MSRVKKKLLWVMATILTFSSTMTALTSCVSNDDNAVPPPADDQNPLGELIKAADGSEAPLWTQDYFSIGSDLTGKDEAIRKMLDATAARDMTSTTPAWVFNSPAAFLGLVCSDHYRENAERTNRLVIDYLKNPLHNASTGIIYMDFAGMDKTPGYNSSTVYETCGLQLVEALINQNFRTTLR